MKIVLFTTSVIGREIPNSLKALLKSIERQKSALPDMDVVHFVLLQNAASLEESDFAFPPFVRLLTTDQKLSLSAARNRMLAEAAEHLTQDNLVAFPDDDCWYPMGSLAAIAQRFRHKSVLDFFFCRYSSSAKEWNGAWSIATAKARDVVRNASSNTVFFRGSLVREIGGFCESLGVGTPNNGGEDIEYALRAYGRARVSQFLDLDIVGHRDKNSSLRPKYFKGNLIAIRTHRVLSAPVFYEYLRKVLIGILITAKGEMRPADLYACLSARLTAEPPRLQ